jgi:hypothetical protein
MSTRILLLRNSYLMLQSPVNDAHSPVWPLWVWKGEGPLLQPKGLSHRRQATNVTLLDRQCPPPKPKRGQ